ncbi:hypothetical protein DENSPDRAFT_752719, partial [Dentipellis sp. KUC8613]
RPQAGPLPSKRGEIGYREEVHGQAQAQQEEGSAGEVAQLPARHPAERSPTPTPPANAGEEPAAGSSTASPSPSANDASSTHSTAKRSIIGFLKPKKVPTYGGVRLTTILPMVIIILIVGGTIAGWVVAVNMLQKNSSTSGSSSIFIYVAFGIVVLAELILLERRVFQVRAERYAHKHPGEMLPTSRLHRTPSRQSTAMPIAPWHRPPLPTYAAALVQSGAGTGDVEDAIIAQPPPPAYGQTRGSMLLLQGYLRNSLRAQAREYEVDRSSRASARSDRPVSFASRDEEWEERRDAERARRLEESLARLEEGGGR